MPILTRQMVLEENQRPNPVATLRAIPDGAAGVSQTLNLMAHFTREYRVNPDIRSLAVSLVRNLPAKDSIAEIINVFEYVRDNIRYTADVRDVETVSTPDTILSTGVGDCDDMSLLIATLLESIGFNTRFVAIGLSEPGYFEHVVAQVALNGNWITLDATERVLAGWQPWQNDQLPPAYMVREV